MARPAKDPMKAIREDITKKFNVATKEFAEEMTYNVEMAYRSVIDSFYAEYTPRSYKRTFSTYLGSNKANDEYGITPVEGGYIAGIKVDDANIPGKPYRADTAWVFERTFAKGIHGFTKAEYADIRDSIDLKLKVEYAMSGAKNTNVRKYVNEKRSQYIINKTKKAPRKFYIKSIKANSPQDAMDKQFKHLTTKKNMNMIFSAILDKQFQ